MNDLSLGYPYRVITLLAAVLALVLIFGMLNLSPGLKWTAAALILLAAIDIIMIRTARIKRAQQRSAEILGQLGTLTADLPRSLRTQMPLLLVVGDGLAQLFLDANQRRLAHVSNGVIWVRVARPQDMPKLAVALRQWRDGRAPDGIVLALAPALHVDQQALTQSLRLIRQAGSDTSRLLGARIPGYVAIYQRLTKGQNEVDGSAPQWYGVSSAKPILEASAFEKVVQSCEADAQRAHPEVVPAWRAASLAEMIQWTRAVVLTALQDRNQPAAGWPLFGIGWIDHGPSSTPQAPWNRHLHKHTHLAAPHFFASNKSWPLPHTLIAGLPQRVWISPRMQALAHAVLLISAAAALAGWAAATNNHALLTQASEKIARFSGIPAAHDAARRDALIALTADRDRLERYERTGLPLHLSFGMYRGGAALPALNAAIASYQPPAPQPTIVTLDSMSLFASGKAQLKPGSTRAMVAALEMIKAHPQNRILVAGHTDNVGDQTSNQHLSVARARAVRDWLTEAADMPPSRFAIQGYGDSRPIADNQTESGRARNRRVEITLVPDSPGT